MSFNLNPGASEFVPTFAVPDMSSLSLSDASTQPPRSSQAAYAQQQAYYDQNPAGQGYYPQQQGSYNPNYRGANPNPNYRGNNYNPNYRGGHSNASHHHASHQFYGQGGHSNGYHYQQQQGYDVDPVELEARCEAVIEILQDDKIRDSLNPSHDPSYVEPAGGYSDQHADEQQCDDEEEMLEMMAMQEECRLEMMKFYIQSQNPTLFEEIYHDVSYPDAAKKVPEEELRSPKVMTHTQQQQQEREMQQKRQQQQPEETRVCENSSLKDLIVNELNPSVDDFVPSKFASESGADL